MRQHYRLQKTFYRICLVSEHDSETLALVPGSDNAHMILQLLQSAMHLREGQRLISFESELRHEEILVEPASD